MLVMFIGGIVLAMACGIAIVNRADGAFWGWPLALAGALGVAFAVICPSYYAWGRWDQNNRQKSGET